MKVITRSMLEAKPSGSHLGVWLDTDYVACISKTPTRLVIDSPGVAAFTLTHVGGTRLASPLGFHTLDDALSRVASLLCRQGAPKMSPFARKLVDALPGPPQVVSDSPHTLRAIHAAMLRAAGSQSCLDNLDEAQFATTARTALEWVFAHPLLSMQEVQRHGLSLADYGEGERS